MTKWNFMLIWVEHEKSFITSGSNLHLRLAHMSGYAASPHIATYKVLFFKCICILYRQASTNCKNCCCSKRTYIHSQKETWGYETSRWGLLVSKTYASERVQGTVLILFEQIRLSKQYRPRWGSRSLFIYFILFYFIFYFNLFIYLFNYFCFFVLRCGRHVTRYT